MQATAQRPRRPRFTCMGLNATGRPVPMLDPFFDGQDEVAEGPSPVGPVELLLFGERCELEADDAPQKRQTTA